MNDLFSLAPGLEAAPLFLFMICSRGAISGGATGANLTWEFYPLVALPAFAMGLQNAALRRVGGRIVRTTYVTGMLTDLAEAGVVLGGGIWLAFVTGAITGGYVQKGGGLWLFLLPPEVLSLKKALPRLYPITPPPAGIKHTSKTKTT